LKVQNQKDHTKRRYSHAWGRDEKSRARVRKSRIREEFEEIERRGGGLKTQREEGNNIEVKVMACLGLAPGLLLLLLQRLLPQRLPRSALLTINTGRTNDE
jgi:hypothetical protein